MSIRTERVAKLIQREVAQLLGNEFSEQVHPLVTVTKSRVTRDLSIAYLYVSIMASTLDERKAAFKHLESLVPRIRTALANEIRHQLRSVPELRFFLDESQEEQRKMNDLFDRIREERERRTSEDGASDEHSEAKNG